MAWLCQYRYQIYHMLCYSQYSVYRVASKTLWDNNIFLLFLDFQTFIGGSMHCQNVTHSQQKQHQWEIAPKHMSQDREVRYSES